MRLALLGACALLSACNIAFGLDETISVDAAILDFDRDGVIDSADNCATVANPDQLNGDGDLFGDACDECPTIDATSNHDDDTDLAADACDPCPGVPDFGDDGDTDNVGDICDPDRMGKNTRLLFEPFETLPPEWQPTGVPWAASADAVSPAELLAPTDGGLANTTANVAAPWIAIVGVRSQQPWALDEEAGIEVKANGHVIRCRVYCDMTNECFVGLSIDGAAPFGAGPLVPRPSTTVRVYVTASNSVGCGSATAGVTTGPTFPITGPATFAVIGSPNMRISYFELIQ